MDSTPADTTYISLSLSLPPSLSLSHTQTYTYTHTHTTASQMMQFTEKGGGSTGLTNSSWPCNVNHANVYPHIPHQDSSSALTSVIGTASTTTDWGQAQTGSQSMRPLSNLTLCTLPQPIAFCVPVAKTVGVQFDEASTVDEHLGSHVAQLNKLSAILQATAVLLQNL